LPAQRPLVRSENVLEKLGVHLRWSIDERRMVSELTSKIDLDHSIIHIDLGFWQSFTTLFRLSLKTSVFVTIHTALPDVAVWRKLVWKVKGGLLSRLKNFHLLASNEDAKRSLLPYLSPAKYAEIEVAYSGFDCSEITRIVEAGNHRSSICERYGIEPNRSLVVSLGQFIERKGCWTVLEALQELKKRSPDFLFIWLGTTVPDAATRSKIDSYDLSDSFRLLTAEDIGKSRDDVLNLLNAADIFVLASLQEGLPIALVEAMVLGKPCIATRINAVPEAIEDGVNGLLVEPGNALQLADAIQTLVDQPELRGRLGSNASKKALASFDARHGADITVRSYARAFADRQQAK
ncbi:MAG: glycosyltransferase family 4 protein, partial [Pyrinomonadaceae bacterium]